MIIVLAPDATRQDDEILRQISAAGFKPLYLPVLADGAHGTGPRELVPPMRAIRPFVAAAGKNPWRESPVLERPARAKSQTKRRPRS
jgi:hypothetical protein